MNNIKEIEDLVKDINSNVEVFIDDESIFTKEVSSVETKLKFSWDILGSVDEIDPYNLNDVLEPRSSCSGKNYKQGLVTLQIKADDKILNFTGYSVVGLREDPIPRACYMLLVDLMYNGNRLFTRSFKLKLQKLWNNSYMRGYDFKIGDTYPFLSSDHTELVEIKSRFFRNKVGIQDFTRSWKKNLAIIICSFINNYILNPESIELSQVVYGVRTDNINSNIQGITLNCKSPIQYIKDMRSEILEDLRKKLIHDQIDLILKELMIKVISVKDINRCLIDPKDLYIDSKPPVIVIIALPKIDGLGPCLVKGLFGERCYIRSKNTFREINKDNLCLKVNRSLQT